MPVIGTAGHVDHGKSSLIEALTGTHPDRLPEERARGMTIDLGFAHFPGREGEPIGIIDVPGHERFLRNMVAGAWGLDAALLAVAADDGWMRQSEDHARVLAALGVGRLALAVTKVDLVSSQREEQVRRQALEHCARLGFAGIPSVAVSARTGQNIPALRELLVALVEGGTAPLDWGPEGCLLYVDRSFLVKGIGVVVTGTLKGGPVERGQELRLLPAGRPVRVRGLQSYFREQDRALPGARVALNLHGAELDQVRRGDCLVNPSAEAWVQRELVLRLSSAGGPAAEELPVRTELEVALGTGHRLAAYVRLEEGLARLAFADPLPAFWNQPCVCLRSGGSQILAAARLCWPGSADRGLRRRLAAALRELPPARRPSDYAQLRLAVDGRIRRRELDRGAPGGQPTRDGVASDAQPGPTAPAAGLPEGAAARGEWLFLSEALRELEKQVLRLAAPAGGAPLQELSARLGLEPDALAAVAAELERAGRLALRGGAAFLPANPEASLSPFARDLLSRLRRAGTAGLEPERLKIAGARKELSTLARAGLAVSLDGAIFYDAETYRTLVRAVLAARQIGELLQIAEARAASGLSRKYLIPLLNRMEADGYVKREGDARRVRRLPD
jgi:selenocysteine-specific elongation factor